MQAAFAFRPSVVPQALAVRRLVDEAEGFMAKMPQVEVPLRHGFGDGLYAREILIPAGALLTGKIHRKEDLNFVLYGEMDVLTESGMKRVVGPCWFTGKAGAKQIGYAYTDTLWITVHATKNRDLETIEDEILRPCPHNLHDFATGKLKARLDYEHLLDELGMTEAQVQAQVTNQEDRMDVDLDGLEVVPSDLHGLGVFTNRPRSAGEVLGPARVFGFRTQLGRYTNHSHAPNAEMVESPEGINLRALASIESGTEITVNYRQAQAVTRGIACRP